MCWFPHVAANCVGSKSKMEWEMFFNFFRNSLGAHHPTLIVKKGRRFGTVSAYVDQIVNPISIRS